MVLFNNFLSGAFHEDLNIDITTDGDQTDKSGTVLIVGDDGGHGGGVAEEEADKASLLVGFEHDEGVHA